MSDFEFLGPDGSVLAPDTAQPARRVPLRVIGAPVAFAAAGIGCALDVLSSFRAVFGLTIPTAAGFAENSFS